LVSLAPLLKTPLTSAGPPPASPPPLPDPVHSPYPYADKPRSSSYRPSTADSRSTPLPSHPIHQTPHTDVIVGVFASPSELPSASQPLLDYRDLGSRWTAVDHLRSRTPERRKRQLLLLLQQGRLHSLHPHPEHTGTTLLAPCSPAHRASASERGRKGHTVLEPGHVVAGFDHTGMDRHGARWGTCRLRRPRGLLG